MTLKEVNTENLDNLFNYRQLHQLYNMEISSALPIPTPPPPKKNPKQNKIHPKKFLIFWEMELSSLNIKKIHIFSQRKAFLIFFQKKSFLIFLEMKLCTSHPNPPPKKTKKIYPPKNYLYFEHGTFLL